MKVLFATYPMAFHTPGGGEIQLLAYKDYLINLGVKVDLFDLWKPKFLHYDLVHFFSCVGGSIHFCKFVKNLGIPLVISSSLWITDETKHQYPIDEIREQLNLADVIISNSIIECDMLSKVINIDRNKFIPVNNGIDESFLKESNPEIFRKEFKIKDSFILNVGNIEPRKNQLLLAESIKKFKELKLVLIGHIRDKYYFNKVMSKTPDQTIYIGYLPNHSELLRSAYKACKIFALPSTLETPGLAALEATAQNAPLLITEKGSTKEYFKNDAFYVDPGSIESIIEGISELIMIDRKKKPKNMNTNFLWKNVVADLATIYSKIKNKDNNS